MLKFDVAAFLLALAFRDDVFDDIASSAQPWEQRVPEGDSLLHLQMKSQKLDLSMLRNVTRHEDLSNRMLDDFTFRYYFRRVVNNAGYYENLIIHALRRAVANAVDSEIFSLFYLCCVMYPYLAFEFLLEFLSLNDYFCPARTEKVTPEERNQLLGHASSDVFNRAYISTVCSVDAQAVFLKKE